MNSVWSSLFLREIEELEAIKEAEEAALAEAEAAAAEAAAEAAAGEDLDRDRSIYGDGDEDNVGHGDHDGCEAAAGGDLGVHSVNFCELHDINHGENYHDYQRWWLYWWFW